MVLRTANMFHSDESDDSLIKSTLRIYFQANAETLMRKSDLARPLVRSF